MSTTDPLAATGVAIVQLGDLDFLHVPADVLTEATARAVRTAINDLPGDTFDVTVHGSRGSRVLTDGSDESAIAEGIARARRESGRASTLVGAASDHSRAPVRIAQIDLKAPSGEPDLSYKLTFTVTTDASMRGHLFQEPPAILNAAAFAAFMRRSIPDLVSQGPYPVRVAVVVGSTSVEAALASAAAADRGELDALPSTRDGDIDPIRVHELEPELLAVVDAAIGQPGSCSQARVIRGVRHGGSLPIGVHIGRPTDRIASVAISPERVTTTARSVPASNEGARP